jgi:zinc transporter, ZIP family
MIYPEELLPAAKRNDEAKLSIYGLIGSMAVMALSLLLFI